MRTVASESKRLHKEMARHIAENFTPEPGFKAAAQLIHSLFEIAATVAALAQVEEEDIEHLDAIGDHAEKGMQLIVAEGI
jgi:hypothetical protein